METYEIFRDLAIILVAAKFCGLAARQLHMPSVVGNIIAGLLVGPCILNLVQPSDFFKPDGGNRRCAADVLRRPGV